MPPKVKLRVPRPAVARVLAQVLAEHALEDVGVEDPPLEEVIADAFSQRAAAKPEPAAAGRS